MIRSKKELKEYIAADDCANSFKGIKRKFNIIRRFLVRLRKTEFYNNCGGGAIPPYI